MEAAGRVRRPPGRRHGLVRAELLVEAGGDLQVERRGQGQRALGHGELARLLETVHALGPELVDGAEFVQRPQPPQLQPVRGGGVRRPGERPLGRLQVTLPGHPADHLESLARDLGLDPLPRAALRRSQRGPGQPVRLLQAALARGDLRGAGVDLGGIGARRVAGDLDARGGFGPAGAGDRRPGDPQVQVSRPRRRRAQPGEEHPAGLDRAVDLPGHGEDLGQRLVDAGPQGGLDQAGGPGQRVLGAGQRADGQVTPPRLEQQRAGPGRVAGPPGQVGGQRAPPAGQARMGRLRRRQGPAGQHGPLRRQQPGQHRFMGQRVPEPEAVPLRHDQLQAHAVAQRRDHGHVGQAGDLAEQRPLEAAAEHRGRADDLPGLRAHAVQPPPDRVGERGRDPGSAQVGGVPAAAPLGQRPVPHQAGQDLLDQERDALGPVRRQTPAARPAGRRRPGRPGSCRPSPAGPAGRAAARRRTRAPRARWPAWRLRRPHPGGWRDTAPVRRRGCRPGTRAAPASPGRPSAGPRGRERSLPAGPGRAAAAGRLRRGRRATPPPAPAAAAATRESAAPVRAGTGRVPRWPAGAPLVRPRSAPRRTAGTAWARPGPRPGRPARSGRARPPRGRSRGPAATCRCLPRRPGTPRCRGPSRPPPGQPAAGGLPRPARPGPGTAPAAQDQYRPGGCGRPS